MRKLISILLLALVGLPLLSPLLALGTDGDAGLRACCRKNGEHHCTMSVSERSRLPEDGPSFVSPHERCPYCPDTVVTAHTGVLAIPSTDAIFASLMGQPSGVAQTESKWRIAHDRSQQKRGPPTQLL